jgi:hypothetical protein
MKEVTSGENYTTVEVDTVEAVKFSFPSTSLSVKVLSGEITVALTETAQAGDDGTITIPEGETEMFNHNRMNVDTYYLIGSGKAVLHASNIGKVNPFNAGKRGGDGGGGRTETVLWENTGTTNPDTITLSEAYTNFDEIVVYDGGGDKGMSSNIYVQSVLSQNAIIGIIEDEGRRIWYRIASPTTLNKADEDTPKNIALHSIIGLKY